ncbi:SLC13 family permease [Reyranella sp.]|uniref:SLC13 family permease n=1 Tax=Reyranella sp. TaxID=1929291 RepID=UPI0027232311|nr:SLC13 family permease [Reyranella sp.]MDO8976107.1 SLC13 family permease [Reyranella sp.]
MALTVAIFLATYVAMAVGRLPGFRVDRTGAALLGAIAMLVFEKIDVDAAWAAVSFPTMALLFGLMIVSGAFSVSGFYGWLTARAAALKLGPAKLLDVMIVTSGVLSSILTNDVVVVAMVPLLLQFCVARRLNTTPFLLGFAFAANSGSAGTIIGSPQNMIIAQGLDLSFVGLMRAAMLPSILSLVVIWGVLVVLYRGRWMNVDAAPASTAAAPPPVTLDRVEIAKAAVVTVLVVAAFCLTDWPRELIALAAGAVLLLNRRIASADVMKHVDGDLFILLGGLFVVNAAFASTGIPQRMIADLTQWGLDLTHPVALLVGSGVLSDIVGNNPAVLLLMPYIQGGNPEQTGAAMALGTAMASNVVVFGSLAGIIVVEEAAKRGAPVSLAEFSRAGVPVSLISMLVAAGWLLLLA